MLRVVRLFELECACSHPNWISPAVPQPHSSSPLGPYVSLLKTHRQYRGIRCRSECNITVAMGAMQRWSVVAVMMVLHD